MPLSRRRLRSVNIWPGFVDALTSLILALIFVFVVFVVAQFTLSEVLSGRDEALRRLNRQIEELAQMLDLERKANADLRQSVAQLSAELQSSILKRDTLSARLSELSTERDKLTQELEAAKAKTEEETKELAQLEQDIAVLRSLRQDLEARVLQGQQALEAEKQVTTEAQRQVELLNRQLLALREQLAALERALEVSEAENKQKDVQIADLGRRLNVALAGKVEELARYRSEFFGKLREILGERSDIRIVGDRFVFQSEVLFPTASDELNPEGEKTLRRLADTLKQIAPKIPPDIHWVLEVDGYTDKRPITTARFPSNWELSTARATAVVKFLVASGVAPEHVSATGFGEFQPIDPGTSEAAYAKNRRIEFKLTQR